MAVAVVDALEVVQVDHQQRQFVAIAARALDLVDGLRQEAAPVGDAGQAVGVGEILQEGLGQLVAGDVLPRADQARGAAIGPASDRLPARLQPDPVAVLVAHAEFGFVARRPAREVGFPGGQPGLGILGVDQGVPGIEIVGQVAGPVAQDAEPAVVRRLHLARRDIHVPVGQVSPHQRQVQQGAEFALALLGAVAQRDVAPAHHHAAVGSRHTGHRAQGRDMAVEQAAVEQLDRPVVGRGLPAVRLQVLQMALRVDQLGGDVPVQRLGVALQQVGRALPQGLEVGVPDQHAAIGPKRQQAVRRGVEGRAGNGVRCADPGLVEHR